MSRAAARSAGLLAPDLASGPPVSHYSQPAFAGRKRRLLLGCRL